VSSLKNAIQDVDALRHDVPLSAGESGARYARAPCTATATAAPKKPCDSESLAAYGKASSTRPRGTLLPLFWPPASPTLATVSMAQGFQDLALLRLKRRI